MKMMNLQCFCIFVYIWWLLKFLMVSFCGKLTNPYRHARTFQLYSQQNLASINNKNPKVLTKRTHEATTVPQAPSAIIGALVYQGMHSDLRSRPEESPHLPGALLPRWLKAVYRVCNGRPHLQLYRKGFTFTIYFNSTEKGLHSLFMIVF